MRAIPYSFWVKGCFMLIWAMVKKEMQLARCKVRKPELCEKYSWHSESEKIKALKATLLSLILWTSISFNSDKHILFWFTTGSLDYSKSQETKFSEFSSLEMQWTLCSLIDPISVSPKAAFLGWGNILAILSRSINKSGNPDNVGIILVFLKYR